MNLHKLETAAAAAAAKHTEAERKLKKAQNAIALKENIAGHKLRRTFERAYKAIDKFNARNHYIARMDKGQRLSPKATALLSRTKALRLESLPSIYLAVATLMEDGRYINTALTTLQCAMDIENATQTIPSAPNSPLQAK